MSNLPEPTSLILVVVMNNPRDLEIARLLGWYRIPLRTSPKIVAVDYLAFYQTKTFGENKWRIQFIAPVRGHELTTRAELLKEEPDHPRAAQDYYKIQLGSLIELPTPILTEKWRRITFLYTTGEYFMSAETVNDLVIHSEERPLIWQALRERASQSQDYRTSDLDQLDLDPSLLAALLGISETRSNQDRLV
jgi:hypothetical protein